MRIRPGAQAVVRRGGDILVVQGFDQIKPETFYRTIGGGIEFGERAEQALRREFIEELAAELSNIRLLGVLENIFEFLGQPGHEIIFMFEAELVDRSWYEREDLGTILDGDSPVSWQPLATFATGEAPLYPAGLPRLLGIT
jgi:NADH pyrophosphatase NudC (nudix superfamily)